MKKMIVLAAFALAPFTTMATEQAVCSGTAGTSTVTVNAVAGTDFVKVGFKPQCSADTLVSVDQNNVALWGASASSKGKNYFAGSTNGGSVKPAGACAASSGCAAGDITSGMTAAAAMGS